MEGLLHIRYIIGLCMPVVDSLISYILLITLDNSSKTTKGYTMLVKHRSALGSSLRYFQRYKPDLLARSMGELATYYGEGKFRPIISRRLPLEQGVEALRLLTDRQAFGKVVVDVAPDVI